MVVRLWTELLLKSVTASQGWRGPPGRRPWTALRQVRSMSPGSFVDAWLI